MTDSRLRMTVHKLPVLDTGIGQEGGYESDAAMMAADGRWLASLDDKTRTAVLEMRAAEQRTFLFGEGL